MFSQLSAETQLAGEGVGGALHTPLICHNDLVLIEAGGNSG
jgi:hypothetical protein